MYQLTLLQRFLSQFIAETIIFRKYRTTAFSRKYSFQMVPNQDEKSRKFQRVVGYDKHPLELEGA